MPRATGPREALGHQVDADDLAGALVLGDPGGHVADRAEPEHDHACRPCGTSAYTTDCHAVGSTSER